MLLEDISFQLILAVALSLFWIFISLSFLKFQVIFNPVSILTVWWIGWLIVSNLSLTGIPAPSVSLQILVLLMLSSYVFGFFLIKKNIIKRIAPESLQGFINKSSPALKWLLIIAALSMIPLVLGFITLASSGYLDSDIGALRVKVFDDEFLFGDPRIGFIYRILVYPLQLFVLVLSTIFIVNGKPSYFYISCFIFIIKSICTFGRAEFFYLLYFVLVAYLLTYGKSQLVFGLANVLFHRIIKFITFSDNKKNMRMNITLFIVVILIISSLSYLNSRRTESLENNQNSLVSGSLGQFIDYNTVGFRLLDLEISNPSSYLNENLFFGQATLGGFELTIRNFLRLNLITQYYEMSLYQQENWVEVAPGKKYNAYYTILYNLYIDGRYISVFLFPFLSGLLTSWIYQGWLNNGNIQSLFYSILIVDTLILSIYKDFASSQSFVMIIVFSGIFFKCYSIKSKLANK